MLVADVVGRGHEVEQQRAGDVVRQIADHAQSGAEPREIHGQRVGLDHRQAVGLELLAQPRGQIAIDLDHRETIQPLQQRPGERGQAGPDFNHRIATGGRDRPTMDSTTLSSVRKFWPKRLRAWC